MTAIAPLDSDSGAAPGRSRVTEFVAILTIAGVICSFAQTVIVPIIGDLPNIFGASPADTSWVMTVTLLAGAVANPVGGRLGDMYGKKRMMLIALAPLIAGSALSGVATSLSMMLVGRALQGLAIGVIPMGISLIHDTVPRERVAGAIALMSASIGIGGGLGLPASAAIAQFTSWRVLFLGSAVAVLVLFVLLAWTVPADARSASRTNPFDYIGTVGLSVGLVALLIPISKGNDWGWASGRVLGLLLGAVVVLLSWGAWEWRTQAPLVDLRVSARPVVLVTNLASVLVGACMYGHLLTLPQLFQIPSGTGYGHGLSMLAMGLWMLPSGFAVILLSPVGGRLIGRVGAKNTFVIGAVVITIGYAASAVAVTSLALLVLAGFVMSCGMGIIYGAVPALILSAVPGEEKAAANGLNALMRSIGSTAMSAVIGAVLGSMTTDYRGLVLPSEGGFTAVLWIATGVGVLTAVLGRSIPVARSRVGDR